MKILAIETSTKNLSIAIADEKSILAEHRGQAILKHSQDLIPNIDLLLKKIGCTLRDLNSLAVSIGPGSFTGLRVGVALLKGLNIATDIPIVAVPTLDVIAHNTAHGPTDICVIVDAKKGNVYCSLYKGSDSGIMRIWDYLLISPDELIGRLGTQSDWNLLFIGDGVGVYRDFLSERLKDARFADERDWSPDAKVVARLGREKFKKGELEDPDRIVPMYIYSRECNVRGIDR